MKREHKEALMKMCPTTEAQVLEKIIQLARDMRANHSPPYLTRYIMLALIGAQEWLEDAHDMVKTGQQRRASEREQKQAESRLRIEAAAKRQPPYDVVPGTLQAIEKTYRPSRD